MSSPSFESKVQKAYIWTTAGNMMKNVVGVGISIVLARLIGPKDYGLLGMALVFTGMMAQLQDAGIGQAVVYNREKTSELPLYFSLAAAIGGSLTAVTFFAAPIVAAFYHNPALIPILRVLSPTLLLGSVSSVSQGALIRDFSFRTTSLIELSGTAIGGVVGIVCALFGLGVWALVANVLVSLSFQMACLCYMVPPRFTTDWPLPRIKQLLRWGLPLTGGSLLWVVYENADTMVVGRMLGDIDVGLYGMAFRLATLVNSKLATILNRVSFPTFAAVQTDHPELVSHWYAITETLGLLTFPVSALVAVNAHDILLVLGAKWLPAAAPLQLLCVIGALKGLIATMTNCMAGIGRTDLSFRFYIANAIGLPIAFALGCHFGGITGVAVAWCIVMPVTFGWFLAKTARLVQASVLEYCLRLRFGLLVTLSCGVAMALAGSPMREGLPRLIVRAVIGVLGMCAGWWLNPLTRRMIETFLLDPLRRRRAAPSANL